MAAYCVSLMSSNVGRCGSVWDAWSGSSNEQLARTTLSQTEMTIESVAGLRHVRLPALRTSAGLRVVSLAVEGSLLSWCRDV